MGSAIPDFIFPAILAVSIFVFFVVLLLPFFEKSNLKERLNLVSRERQNLKEKQFEKLEKEANQKSKEPHKYAILLGEKFHIFDNKERFRELTFKLANAGYRGKGPVMNYIAAQFALPFVFGVFTFVYTLLFFNLIFVYVIGATALGALFGFFLPMILVQNKIAKRQLTIKRAWPDALDLILLCVESGMSIEVSIKRIAPEIGHQSVELSEELAVLDSELSFLSDRSIAYDNFANRIGLDSVKNVITALIQSERYGTSVGQTLRVMAEENRALRMSEAERKAAALPPKLTVPLIACFIPVLFIVILSPAIIQAFGV